MVKSFLEGNRNFSIMLIALKKLTKILIEPFKYPHRPLDGFWYITYIIQVMKFQSSATELFELSFQRNTSLPWWKFNIQKKNKLPPLWCIIPMEMLVHCKYFDCSQYSFWQCYISHCNLVVHVTAQNRNWSQTVLLDVTECHGYSCSKVVY